ncbi:hypothetical protein EV127DRAFT_512835 [Xylaria flabelliformis]|nr:hypothetical protein EV127DRAFT_512835 [Xylaria flabelliformis]
MVGHPVCCVVEMPIANLNKLLDQAQSGSEELIPNSEYELTIVGENSDGSSKLPDSVTIPPLNDGFKPFIASSVEDATKTTGETAYFAVLDQQSTNDDSAILVHRQTDGSLETARAAFKSVQTLLVSLSMATLGFQEIKSIAHSQSGVYGRPVETPGKGGAAPRKRLGGS